MDALRWSTEDFDALSWHDCHVHGLRIAEGEHGTGELEFDIDHIAEWRCGNDGTSFVLVPCTLRFHKVCGLRITLEGHAARDRILRAAGMGAAGQRLLSAREDRRARTSSAPRRRAGLSRARRP